jgi:hypothetical protein
VVTWPESGGAHAEPAPIPEGSSGEADDDGAVGECGDDGAETPPPPEPQEVGGGDEVLVGLIVADGDDDAAAAADAVFADPVTVAPPLAPTAGLLPLLAPMLTSGWTAAEVAYAAVQAPQVNTSTRERREPVPPVRPNAAWELIRHPGGRAPRPASVRPPLTAPPLLPSLSRRRAGELPAAGGG